MKKPVLRDTERDLWQTDGRQTMNKRQKKKQYKKIHGCNPPKEIRQQETAEQPVCEVVFDVSCLTKAMEQICRNLSEFAAAVSKAFGTMADYYKEPVEEPPEVTIARTLAERRQTGCRNRRKGWRQSLR